MDLLTVGVIAGIVGGFVGGVLGVLGTLVSSYYGPRKLEEWREQRKEERDYGPRKRLLKQMLENPDHPEGRYLETLHLRTGTTQEDCRRLLIEIGARGIKLKHGEGWTLKPLLEQ